MWLGLSVQSNKLPGMLGLNLSCEKGKGSCLCVHASVCMCVLVYERPKDIKQAW